MAKRTQRRTAIKKTEKAQERFLRAYEREGTIVHASARAKIGRRTHYEWLDADTPETPTGYRERFAHAEEVAIQNLEREMRRRAIEGIEEPVFYQGAVCGRVRKFSDVLLIFALKAKRREVYADRHEHTGKNGEPLHPPVAKLTDAELEAELRAELAVLERKKRPA